MRTDGDSVVVAENTVLRELRSADTRLLLSCLFFPSGHDQHSIQVSMSAWPLIAVQVAEKATFGKSQMEAPYCLISALAVMRKSSSVSSFCANEPRVAEQNMHPIYRQALFHPQCAHGIGGCCAAGRYDRCYRRGGQKQHYAAADGERIHDGRLVEEAAHPAQRDQCHCEPTPAPRRTGYAA